MVFFWLAVSVVIGYLSGAIPFGVIISKYFFKVDIRKHGSGNIGAANVYRIIGPKAGISVFICDAIKGAVPVLLASLISKGNSAVMLSSGVMAIVGHMYSPFIGFRGGKGVATGAGVFLALVPIPTLIALAVFIVTVAVSKYISLGSIVAAVSLPVIVAIVNYSWMITFFSVIAGILVVYKHESNIKRIVTGKENKFMFKPREAVEDNK
ncbi:MAG: glycerol-3-phosphate 1-O-acyltransferase PlsY [Elusimicrobiota bacterium]